MAYWAARQSGGELVLRIDDLDSPRTKPWAIEQASEDIRWLGINWDHGPVLQTSHQPQYRDALQSLIEQDLVYPCVCSRNDIAHALSAPHENRFRGEGPIYPGTCSGFRRGDPLPESPYCWRLRTLERALSFSDRCAGPQSCRLASELGDFPITTKQGHVSYQLAVVIDDLTQGVDQVVRGNDLIASTFRQLQLYDQLRQPPPTYAHVPLVCGSDGRRLAKRHGDTRLSQFRERGIKPEWIVGWAAHSLGMIDSLQPCSASELTDLFSWQKIGPDDTTLDVNLFESLT